MQVCGSRQEILSCLEKVEEIEKIEWLEEEGGFSTFVLSLLHDNREAINQHLVNGRLGVREITRVDLDLENLFLQLMERGEKVL